MGGWDTRRVQLKAPYADNWIDVYEDPPWGVYGKLQQTMLGVPDEAGLNKALALLGGGLVADSNLANRDGSPLTEWSTRTMGAKLIAQITAAVKSVQDDEGGEPEDPLPTRSSSPSKGATNRRRTSAPGS